MEDTNQGALSADEGAQPAAAQADAGGSGGWLDDAGPSEESALLGDFLRSDRSSTAISTSKPSSPASDGGSTAEQSADVKPSEPAAERDANGRFVPRRAVPKVLADADARVAEAEQKAATTDPEKLREQIRAEVEAENQRKSDAAAAEKLTEAATADFKRYERLRDLPANEMSAEDWNWVEEYRDTLKRVPRAEAHYRAEYESRAQAAEQKHEANFHTAMNGIVAQMGSVGSRLGIDTSAWQAQGVTFADIASDIEAAVRAEYRELEAENRQLRLTGPRGLGTARTGLNGGMPDGGAPSQNPNDLFRAILRG